MRQRELDVTGIDPAVRTELVDIVGPGHVITDPDMRATYEVDWTRRWTGSASVVVRPADTAELSGSWACATVTIWAASPKAVAPVSSAGACPMGGDVAISLERLDQVERSRRGGGQLTAGAGVTLAELHRQAAAAGWAFGVDLAARDSATVGGMVATNAGGIAGHPIRPDAIPGHRAGVRAGRRDDRPSARRAGQGQCRIRPVPAHGGERRDPGHRDRGSSPAGAGAPGPGDGHDRPRAAGAGHRHRGRAQAFGRLAGGGRGVRRGGDGRGVDPPRGRNPRWTATPGT